MHRGQPAVWLSLWMESLDVVTLISLQWASGDTELPTATSCLPPSTKCVHVNLEPILKFILACVMNLYLLAIAA